MRKKQSSLESGERPRLTSGNTDRTDEYSFAFWNEVDRDINRKKQLKRIVKRLRGAVILLALIIVIVLCVLFFVPDEPVGDLPVDSGTSDDISSETESESVSEESTTQSVTTDSVESSEDTSMDTTASTESEDSTETTDAPSKPVGIYDFDYSAVPEGSLAIIPEDLSLISYGESYISNSTGYSPNVKDLIYSELEDENEIEWLSATDDPLVLIMHTHGTEAFMPSGAIYYTDDGREFARSHNNKENIVAAGRVLTDVLNRAGIPTVHSTVLHDSVQYKDSYKRAEETIKSYLEKYPSIKFVIDLHRDSLMNSSGDIIKPITVADGDRCAQIKFTVGSSWLGGEYENWERNLAIALKLRKALNEKYTNVCRPVSLEGTTYNQEIAAYSMLVDIGSIGNSLEEAMCAADVFGETLAELIKKL